MSEEPKRLHSNRKRLAEKERVRKAREAAERGRDILFAENLGELASEARHDLEAARCRDRASIGRQLD